LVPTVPMKTPSDRTAGSDRLGPEGDERTSLQLLE
jgi:hypothetical protein